MAFKGAIVLLWLCTATLTWITVEGQGILGKFRDGIKNMLQLTICQVIFFYDLLWPALDQINFANAD